LSPNLSCIHPCRQRDRIRFTAAVGKIGLDRGGSYTILFNCEFGADIAPASDTSGALT
jgi:hypothetical protein